jgi:hypothetical protein
MDVKYLHKMGCIEKKENKYSNVVGVTNDPDAFRKSNSELDTRLELLVLGDINELLGGVSRSETVAQLKSAFPFTVINLDYTDVLHRPGLNQEISAHVQAVDEILRLQSKSNQDEFVLFLTAFVKLEHYNQQFLDLLLSVLDANILKTPDFSAAFQQQYDCGTASEFLKKDSNSYFLVALSKFILKLLGQYSYRIEKWDALWLERNNGKHLLHLAFHTKKYIPSKTNKRGLLLSREIELERRAMYFIKDRYSRLNERHDLARLLAIHQGEITELNEHRFEIKTPSAKGGG